MTEILVTGASGFVGSRLFAALAADGHSVTGTFSAHEARIPSVKGHVQHVALDLTDDASIERAFRASWPEVIVHTAAMSELRACEAEPERAARVNVAASEKLARMAAAFGARMILLSTDQVFDGARGNYAENDESSPIHVYGRTKLDAEHAVRRAHPAALVLRLALVYGISPSGTRTPNEHVVTQIRSGGRPKLFTDEYRSPVLVDDVVRAIVELLTDKSTTMLHLGGPDRVSRFEFGRAIAAAFGLDVAAIEAVRLADSDAVPKRPPDLSFDTGRARSCLRHPPRSIAEALETIVRASPSQERS